MIAHVRLTLMSGPQQTKLRFKANFVNVGTKSNEIRSRWDHVLI